MNEETADLPPVVPQTVVNEAKPEDDVQFPKADTDKDICYRAVSSLPKGVPPPPVEAPPPPPTTTTEKPLSVFALVPPSSVPKPDTLKIEDQTPPEPPVSVPLPIQISVPVAPPLPVENQGPGVNFRRQPSLSSRDTRSKELLSRHKSAPIPKEDANIPLVTPSLLQMVRLRSVSMAEDQVKATSEDNKDGLPARLGLRSSTSSSTSDPGAPSPKSPDIGDMHKSPASTASFIFSRSTKKVVIETPVATPEAQASLKQSLAAELMQVSDHSKAIAFSNGGMRSDKVPPPVAKKPAHGSSNPSLKLPAFSAKMELSTETNGVMATVQPVGQKTPPTETSESCNVIN
uniref:KIAA1522 n=1 Tax=Myripristis murdjan TaxID=586833 RepID=A0A667XNM2_9TELE